MNEGVTALRNRCLNHLPDKLKPFKGSNKHTSMSHTAIPETKPDKDVVFYHRLDDVFRDLKIKNGMTLSFHHHLRNGDKVVNRVCEKIGHTDIKSINLAPSAVFPAYDKLADLIEKGKVHDLHTNYISGRTGDLITDHRLTGMLRMNTHGGRARAISSGDLHIDVAFLATPAVDKKGNGSGAYGENACGTLGYAMSDLKYADHVVLVTDNVTDALEDIDFDHAYVDAVLIVDHIGDAKEIVSGTTKITTHPVNLKIAHMTAQLLKELGMVKNGFSMQTGAGGTSLAVAAEIKRHMEEKNIRGSFASGGITGFLVDMLENDMFDRLYDVQCFDLEAVRSYRENDNHLAMSADEYANPFYRDPVVNRLDFVILGATEIDLDFNCNVTTDSLYRLMGGSGGHADTAYGAELTIVTSTLIKSRIPLIKDHVNTITTPGEDIDVVVTERGIAVNGQRKDLLKQLEGTHLPIMTIGELQKTAHRFTRRPKPIITGKDVVGYVEYRDGTIIDCIHEHRQ